jgi:hypothetical protein
MFIETVDTQSLQGSERDFPLAPCGFVKGTRCYEYLAPNGTNGRSTLCAKFCFSLEIVTDDAPRKISCCKKFWPAVRLAGFIKINT